LTQLDQEIMQTEHSASNPMQKKDFSAHTSLHQVHCFQNFAAVTLNLDGQDFHVRQAQPLVSSGRGLILATLRRGETTILSAGQIETLKPADFAIIPLGADVTFRGADCELDCLVIDEQLKPLLPTGLSDEAPIILSALLPATSLLYQQFICFRAYTNLMQGEDVEELLPPLLMMLNTIFKRYAGNKGTTGDSQLDKVCTFISQNLLDPDLDPDMVAKHLGLSRARLYRLAEPLGGIGKYIRAKRLQLAHEKLRHGGKGVGSISNLAFDLGFGTETAFRRAFKEAFGMTPSELRNLKR